MENQALLAGVRGRSPTLNEAFILAEAFTALLRGREAAQLDDWLHRAENSAVPPLQRFAKRLRADCDAVRAAMSLGWSNGQTEGQINRLKTIKTSDVWSCRPRPAGTQVPARRMVRTGSIP